MAALGFLVQLPLALPPLTSGILLLFLVGYGSPLGRLVAGALTDSFAGIVLAEAFVAAPFLIVAARSAFASIDPVLEAVSATLCRGPLDVFFRISLPIARPYILSGLLLSWLRAFGEFGATVMVAYHPYSLPVYTYVAFGAQGLPAMLPILAPTLVIALAMMALNGAVLDRISRPTSRPSRTSLERIAAPELPAAASPKRADTIDLKLRFAKRLGDFRLDVAWAPQSRRLAIVGPSGSGKSLTLKLIAGIERCDDGAIAVNDRDLTPLDPAVRGIAYVPQNYGQFPHFTVGQHMRFPVGAEQNSTDKWVARLGLLGLEQRRPAALSLGQQQRVALARAGQAGRSVVARRAVLGLGCAAASATARRNARAARRTSAHDHHRHPRSDGSRLARRRNSRARRQVLQSGPTGDLFGRPGNEIVARVLGAETTGEGFVVDKDKIAIGGGATLNVAGPPLRTGERVGWSFSSACARISAAGAYQGTAERIATVGTERRIVVRFGGTRIWILDGQGTPLRAELCRFDVGPESVQLAPQIGLSCLDFKLW